jgi:uncharacterized protein
MVRTTLTPLLLVACGARARVQETAGGPAVLVRGRMGNPALVRVELARTPQERARGLMFRKQLDEDAGMLFLFDRTEVLTFWMKNTFVPLDMIFIDADRRVVGVVQGAQPLTTESRSVGQPSRYVLEVNAGFAAQHGVGTGTVVEFRNIATEGAPR